MDRKTETSTKVIELSADKSIKNVTELGITKPEISKKDIQDCCSNSVINLKQIEIDKMVNEITSLIWK